MPKYALVVLQLVTSYYDGYIAEVSNSVDGLSLDPDILVNKTGYLNDFF